MSADFTRVIITISLTFTFANGLSVSILVKHPTAPHMHAPQALT